MKFKYEMFYPGWHRFTLAPGIEAVPLWAMIPNWFGPDWWVMMPLGCGRGA